MIKKFASAYSGQEGVKKMVNPNLVPKKTVRNDGVTTTVHVNPDKNGGVTNAERKNLLRSPAVPPNPADLEAPTDNPHALRLPADLNFGEKDTTPLAAEYVDEYLQGGEYSSEPICARSDYASIGEEGIAYGVTIRDDYIGQVFAGPKLPDETDEEYSERCMTLAHTNLAFEFLAAQFGADAVEGGDDYTNIEFFVEYPTGDPEAVSLGYMGHLAETETKLLEVQNAYSYGTKLQSMVAKEFGYEWRLTDDANRQVGDGYWAKKEY
jgi:hypothetical protein